MVPCMVPAVSVVSASVLGYSTYFLGPRCRTWFLGALSVCGVCSGLLGAFVCLRSP